MDCHRKDFEIAEELGDKGGVGTAHGNMGNAYYSIGRYQKAIDCHRIALEIAEELGDRSGIGRGHGNFIKIAYSGDFSTPPPNQSGFATPLLEHSSCESA